MSESFLKSINSGHSTQLFAAIIEFEIAFGFIIIFSKSLQIDQKSIGNARISVSQYVAIGADKTKAAGAKTEEN